MSVYKICVILYLVVSMKIFHLFLLICLRQPGISEPASCRGGKLFRSRVATKKQTLASLSEHRKEFRKALESEFESERRALSYNTLDLYVALMILDNATAYGQTKTVPNVLGGETGFKNLLKLLFWNARPRVLHLNNQKGAILFCSRPCYDYTLVHRVCSIGIEVHQNLMDLALVGFHRRQMDIEFELDSSETFLPTNEVNQLMHKAIQI